MKFLDVPQAGSWAGVTHQRSRAGQVRRNRRAPVQPFGFGRRQLVRSRLATVSSDWRLISAPLQAGWNAISRNFPRTDALGQTFYLTGHQLFVSLNAQLLNCGGTIHADQPVPHISAIVTISSFSHSFTGDSLTLTFSGTGSSTDFILVALSAGVSAGVSRPPAFYQLGVVAGNATSLSGISTLFVNRFGNVVPGMKIFCKLTPVSQFGVTGTPTIGSCIGT